ncbi:unnamed protein product [Didymodactylos carnosus]|uniref:Tetratricopeptide repeat protein n=1 Tax=Didymodactylos carnosus TaxID=1234261 RepID=A0A815ZBZ6_9BILA|nr:unnamed protein product [Didymodactylos carnosus]CAF1582535.1 unnamed protein product [Didymodactylos carnosus]CAF4103650.1 unnamed protein product [Didymodactylos carnosus]CAF4450655.1 unnamed protein product [Didymodactylos carnosus]
MNANDSALEMYSKAMKIQEKLVSSSNDPVTADLYQKISGVYLKKGDYDKAMDAARIALNINEQILPSVHPFIAESYHHLGKIYPLNDDLNGALECFVKKMKIYETIYPSYHRLRISTKEEIAIINKNIKLMETKTQLLGLLNRGQK